MVIRGIGHSTNDKRENTEALISFREITELHGGPQ